MRQGSNGQTGPPLQDGTYKISGAQQNERKTDKRDLAESEARGTRLGCHPRRRQVHPVHPGTHIHFAINLVIQLPYATNDSNLMENHGLLLQLVQM